MRFSSFQMLRFLRIVTLIAIVVFLGACAELSAPDAAVDAVTPPVSTQDRYCRETGIAGWYGKDFHGKKTASGEVFDMHAISAAHRTLPLGTLVRVTNLDNFKIVKLRITDRGPFVRTRIMDLSLGAAKELGFFAQGSARVKIETIESVRESTPYTVLAAVFTEQENARLLKERLNKRFEVVSIIPFETNLATFYRVWVGSYSTEERAELVAGKLTLEGLEPMVARKD
jgi:rare lipoprotein A